MNINELRLGAIPLSPDVLGKAKIGLWAFELDEGSEPRMYVDNTMLGLLGLDHQVPPEETYHAWYDHVDPDSYNLVNDAVAKMSAGELSEVQYPWHHPDGSTMVVRCGGTRNWAYTKGIRVEGTHQNVSEVLHFDKEEAERAKKAAERDDMVRMMNMIISLSGEFDPIMVLDPETGEYDWYRSLNDDVDINTSMSVHGDDLYKNIGIDAATIIHEEDRAQFQAFYTKKNMMQVATTGETQEIENRWFIQTEGQYKWKYNKAVRMMDDSGKAYVVIGVIDTTERKKEEEKRKQDIDLIAALTENNQRVMALEDNLESIYDADLEGGEYICYAKGNFYRQNVLDKLREPGDFYEDLRINVDSVIHPDDREDLFALLNREALRKALDATDRVEHFYRMYIGGVPTWFKIRVVYKDKDKKNIIIGCFNAEKEMEERRQNELTAKRNEELANSFASQYTAVYYGSLVDGSYKILVKRDNVISLIAGTTTICDAIKAYAEKVVHPDDLDLFRKDFYTLEDIDAKLGMGESYTFVFRSNSYGEYRWFRAEFRRIDAQDILVGFKDCHDEVIEKLEHERLQKNHAEQSIFTSYFFRHYRTAYYVDLNTCEAKIYKHSFYPSLEGTMMPDFFAKMLEKIQTTIAPEDRERIKEIFDLTNIRAKWARNKSLSAVFRDMASGDERFVRMEIVAGADEDHIAVGFRDITEDRRKEQQRQLELQKALQSAREASQAKTTFLNSMSHDIRTPMNAIIGYTSMAKKYIADQDKAMGFLDKIGSAGGNLLELVNQVLDMSRIESGAVVLSEDPADVVEKAAEMAEIFTPSAQAKNIKISTIIHNVPNRKVYADCGRVNQLLINIMGNAVKYTPSGGEITYSVTQIPCDKAGYGTYVFSVKDTGIGMSQEYLDKIFEPFSRENTSTVSKIQGSGLGMSIVKKLTELMGGDINIETEQGKGTKVDITLTFKLQKAKKEIEVKEDSHVEVNLFRGRRTLLVEDNEMNREIATMILEERGLIVEHAEDGDIAIEKYKAIVERGDWDYYDFILMDIQMPRMTGYEATKAIRAIPVPEGVHIPIIAMTANAFAEDRQLALDAGMDEHIAKPIDVMQLWQTLAKFL